MIFPKYIKYLYVFLLSFLFVACAKEEMTESKNKVEIDAENTATISYDGFYPGDMVTRSALEYDGNRLLFSWSGNEKFGIFPTGKLNENNEHSNNDTRVSQASFTLTSIYESGQDAHITSDNSYFHFLSNYRYTAYTTNKGLDLNVTYDKVPFNFSGQTQKGLTDMHAYYTGGYDSRNREKYELYKKSEQESCKHLGKCDVLMSPETVSDERPLNFSMRHVGAVARCFLKVPPGNHQKLRIKELKLIANKKIFYEGGYMNLTSHPFNKDQVPSDAVPSNPSGAQNYGLDFGTQLSPDESTLTDCITLKFDDGCPNQEKHPGVWNNWKPKEEDQYSYGSYVIAYIMMYPINYSTSEASAFIYVVAEDEEGKDVRFQTKRLASKNMTSGYVYQWTTTPNENDPIELTATLLDWQDIVSDGINTDLE